MEENNRVPVKRKSRRQINRLSKKTTINIVSTVEREQMVYARATDVDECCAGPSSNTFESNIGLENEVVTLSTSSIASPSKYEELDESRSIPSTSSFSNEDDSQPLSSNSEDGHDSDDEILFNIHRPRNVMSSTSFLKTWSLNHNITHSALSDLLKWLNTNPNLENLPSDARALLKTPSKNCLSNMGQGQFYYFGLRAGILKVFQKYHDGNLNYSLDFNIDGLPIHKSTKESFWPILCKIAEYSNEPPFPVAIYSGMTKPPLSNFFVQFINEMKNYLTDGLRHGSSVINILCRSFCCDTPARCFIKNTKGHNAYYGCDKCLDSGIYENHKVVFIDLRAELRSDEGFLSGSYGEYHKGPSPLSDLNIGMVSTFPNDYMHSVCLGVVKKLLFIWRDGSRLYRFKIEKFHALEERIKTLKSFWPAEFNRKPRSLKDLEHWKATEYRQFLLYISPLLFDILPKNCFCNLMLLKFGITILVNSRLNSEYNDYAKTLLTTFVKNAIQIYGKDFCVYNVHSLIHIADDAKKFGSLSEVNCFTFENYLGFLKNSLRKSNQCLQQVVNRILEGRELSKNNAIDDNHIQILGKPLNISTVDVLYFKKILFKNCIFSVETGNNCVFLKNGEILLITSISKSNNKIYIKGQHLKKIKPFLNYPTPSDLIFLFEVSLNCDELTEHIYRMDDIQFKGILLEHENNISFHLCIIAFQVSTSWGSYELSVI